MDVFYAFSTLGIVFYQGPVDQIVPFYSQLGCICPENYNPSDFVMNLAQSGSVKELQTQNLFVPVPADLQHKRESAKEFGEKDEVNFTTWYVFRSISFRCTLSPACCI
jgi:hypothetical protein